MCEMPLCMTQNNVKARKEHHCCECGEIIKPGDKYEKISGVWGGGIGPDSFKTCLKCVELRSEVRSWDAVDCLAFGELYETIGEYYSHKEQIALGLPKSVSQVVFEAATEDCYSHEVYAARYDLIDWSKTG